MEGLVAVILGVSPLKTAVPAPSPTSPQAMKQWLSGQEAMRGGRPRQAITAYQKALEVDPTLARAHLSLAAAHLDLQEDHLAADHLRRYLSHQPEHVQVRQHLADLLFRLGQHALAEAEYRHTLADVSPDPTGILCRIH
jgi:tetratricopeptide (TPR) repeat protein